MTIGSFLNALKIMPEGWFSTEDALILAYYAEQTEGAIVEMGSFMGRSTVLLGSLGRIVYAIDPWEDFEGHSGADIYKEFRRATKQFSVIPKKMKVEDWKPIIAGFVFCDGDHSYEGTLRQIEKALECKPKFIAVHDYVKDTPGVIEACDKLLGPCHDKRDRVGVWAL